MPEEIATASWKTEALVGTEEPEESRLHRGWQEDLALRCPVYGIWRLRCITITFGTSGDLGAHRGLAAEAE